MHVKKIKYTLESLKYAKKKIMFINIDVRLNEIFIIIFIVIFLSYLTAFCYKKR